MIGRAAGHLVVETLRKCGDDLTREDVMRQAANFHNYRIPMLFRPADQHQVDRLRADAISAFRTLRRRSFRAVR
jgi:hypothetical protein